MRVPSMPMTTLRWMPPRPSMSVPARMVVCCAVATAGAQSRAAPRRATIFASMRMRFLLVMDQARNEAWRVLSQYHAREPKRQRRNIRHECKHDEHRDIENQDAARHCFHAHTADRTAHDHGRPDRRGEQSDPQVED